VPSAESLRELEARLDRALSLDEPHRELEVLGYGEISCVVAWREGDATWAMKRLPDFPDMAALERYRACFDEYTRSLAEGGISVVASELQVIEGARSIAWCVQPILDGKGLGPSFLAAASEEKATALFTKLLDTIERVVSPRLGLDGQLSNWFVEEGAEGISLQYLDITTPMLRDAGGQDRLDLSIFMASLPWIMRPIVRRFMLREILDKYYDPRGIVLDLLGNLKKEKLDRFLPIFLPLANARFSGKPFSEAEITRYYERDAADWALLQRARRIDRAWQRNVRRRKYPFLIPGAIER